MKKWSQEINLFKVYMVEVLKEKEGGHWRPKDKEVRRDMKKCRVAEYMVTIPLSEKVELI